MAEQNQQSYGGQSQMPVSRREHFSSRSSQGTPMRLLLFSFGFFLFTGLIWAGLNYGYGGFLDKQIEDVDNELRHLTERVSPEEQRELSLFYSRLASLDLILKNRKKSVKIFGLLENKAHPNVYYTKVNYSSSEGKIEADAIAGSLRDVIEQLSIFEKEENLFRITVDNIQREGPNINFTLSLEFNKQFFTENL